MNLLARKYIDLFRQVKIASAATVDEQGHPQTRIINIMLVEDEGMYIITAKGKPFYDQLVNTGEIALSAMCPQCQSLKFTGRVKPVEKKWLDRVFEENPGMNEVYPEKTRDILCVFLIYEGWGEWFDLLNYPINRESFAYGTEIPKAGFRIADNCTQCGACLTVCPQNCILKETPFKIQENHCLQCGACKEACRQGAVESMHL